MSVVCTSLLSCLLISNIAFANEDRAVVRASPQLHAASAVAFNADLLQLEAQGPGTLFRTIEDAAVDALTYAYLQGHATRVSKRMRGGTIYREGNRYSYGALQVAGPLAAHRINQLLRPNDVARFLVYPQVGRRKVDRANERPSRSDRRSVTFTDPLHRPLYILHPSLVIREYRGENYEIVEVADLKSSTREILNSENRETKPSSLLASR
jgi:hypothetical protein